MCVLLGAFDLLRHNTNGALSIRLTPGMSFLWLLTACTLGVLLAVPLRRHFVVDEKLPYPDGTCGGRDHPRDGPAARGQRDGQAQRTARVQGGDVGGRVSALLMIFRDDTQLVPHIRHALGVVSGARPGWVPLVRKASTRRGRCSAPTARPPGAHGVVLAGLGVGGVPTASSTSAPA